MIKGVYSPNTLIFRLAYRSIITTKSSSPTTIVINLIGSSVIVNS